MASNEKPVYINDWREYALIKNTLERENRKRIKRFWLFEKEGEIHCDILYKNGEREIIDNTWFLNEEKHKKEYEIFVSPFNYWQERFARPIDPLDWGLSENELKVYLERGAFTWYSHEELFGYLHLPSRTSPDGRMRIKVKLRGGENIYGKKEFLIEPLEKDDQNLFKELDNHEVMLGMMGDLGEEIAFSKIRINGKRPAYLCPLRKRSQEEQSENPLNVLLTPKKYEELNWEVNTIFAEEIADISLIKKHNHEVYEIVLDSGKKIILKEFSPLYKVKLEIEKNVIGRISQLGMTPRIHAAVENKIFYDFVGNHSLADFEPWMGERFYDFAIDFIDSLGKLGKKFNETDFPKIFHPHEKNDQMLIHSNLYPQHIIIDDQRNPKVIDLEHICFGPVEYSLARLLVNSSHELSPEFIYQKLDYYLRLNPQKNSKEFYQNFEVFKNQILLKMVKKFEEIIKSEGGNKIEAERIRERLISRISQHI